MLLNPYRSASVSRSIVDKRQQFSSTIQRYAILRSHHLKWSSTVLAGTRYHVPHSLTDLWEIQAGPTNVSDGLWTHVTPTYRYMNLDKIKTTKELKQGTMRHEALPHDAR